MSSRDWTILAYGSVIALAVLVEAVARWGVGRVPTFAGFLGSSLSRRSTQIGLLVAWWWLGWHFITAS